MFRNISMLSALFVILIVFSSNTSYASYTMADYWAFNEGNVWVYDRDLQVMGTETYTFSQYVGKQFLQINGFYSNHPYVYSGSEGVLGVGMYIVDTQQFIDLSENPIKFSDAEMDIGESVTHTIPAGVIDDHAISFTITLEASETVTVPAGTYNNALRIKIEIEDGLGIYTEQIWLAKNVGMVKMYRVSETNNTPGCMFTCGSFDDEDIIERTIQLNSFIEGKSEVKNKVIVIPLGD